jgi:hypothetical protein
MTTTEHSTVVGIFTDHLQAQQAINELHNQGFTDDQISSNAGNAPVTSDTTVSDAKNSKLVEYLSVGAASGGVAGGIVGAAASLTISSFNLAIAGGIVAIIIGGVLVGAIAGGIVGVLISQWGPGAEADLPLNEPEPERTTVTVNTPGREQEVADLLRRFGAENTTTHPGVHETPINTNSPPA